MDKIPRVSVIEEFHCTAILKYALKSMKCSYLHPTDWPGSVYSALCGSLQDWNNACRIIVANLMKWIVFAITLLDVLGLGMRPVKHNTICMQIYTMNVTMQPKQMNNGHAVPCIFVSRKPQSVVDFNSLTTLGHLLWVFFRLWIPFLVCISTSASS